ncbi:MAG: endonuclease domain-containing protein [Candidatus Paceibacterota bacterium]|jgi:leucyl-tRNA synthetase
MKENEPKNNYKKLFNLSRQLRKDQTNSEDIVWFALRNRKIFDLKFSRQKIFGEFIVDFYCARLGLVLEIDGEIHESQKEHDQERENYLINNYNLKILRIKNSEIDESTIFELLENKIKKYL